MGGLEMMKRLVPIVMALALAGTACAAPGFTRATRNLCYNGSFDVENSPLDGWTYDYRWAGNSHYMQNHTRVSVVESHSGKRNVLCIRGGAETKAESRAIPFELGAKYRCTLRHKGSMPHIYFTGYKWKPGVRPHENPHLGDLRRIYKSQFRGHKIKGGSGGWKTVTFEFPLDNPSKLAMKHLKYIRLFTVYIIMITGTPGEAYIDDVVVTRIK